MIMCLDSPRQVDTWNRNRDLRITAEFIKSKSQGDITEHNPRDVFSAAPRERLVKLDYINGTVRCELEVRNFRFMLILWGNTLWFTGRYHRAVANSVEKMTKENWAGSTVE